MPSALLVHFVFPQLLSLALPTAAPSARSRSAASGPPVYDFEDISSIFDVETPASGDVTAVVTSVGPQLTHETPKGEKVQKMVIKLEDHSASVILTLWREAAALDFPLDEIVTVTNAKVAKDGLWSTSKTAYAINPATAPPTLLARNVALKAAKAVDGKVAISASAPGLRADSEQ